MEKQTQGCAGIWFVWLLVVAGACSLPLFVYGEENAQVEREPALTSPDQPDSTYSVVPVVANEKAKPRDIVKKELLVTNHTDRRLDLYISVVNIDPASGAHVPNSLGVADLSQSFANWIEITRGVVELSPGESRRIPYLIHVNLSAKPGSYFARIQFAPGSSRVEAEARPFEEGTGLLLNLEVVDDAKERLQLGRFITDRSVVTGEEASFSYMLENIGNRDIQPRGSIRIFNRKGEEVGSVPVNQNGEGISPEHKKQLAAAWNAAGRFGKYKAFLDIEYGESQRASVQDTIYFWVFPWREIMFALVGVGILAVVGTGIVHMRAIAHPVSHAMAYATVSEQVPVGVSGAEVVVEPHTPVPGSFERRMSPAPAQTTVTLSRRERGATRSAAQPAGRARTSQTVSGSTVSLARRGR